MRRDGLRLRSGLQHPAQPEQVCGDAGRPLHPAHSGRQQRLLVAVLEEAPVRVSVRHDGPLDEGVPEPDREGELAVVAGPGVRVEEGVPHGCRAAAAAVVVPEPGPQPVRQAGHPDAVPAPRIPARRRLSRDLGDPGAVEGEEQHRGAGGTVAPAVRDGVGASRVGRRDGQRDDEPAVGGVAESHEVLGTSSGGLDEVGAVELAARERQRGGDAGQPVRPVRQLGSRLELEPRRHHVPVQPGRLVLGLGHEDLGGPLREVPGPTDVTAHRPHGREEDRRGAEGRVVDAGVRPVVHVRQRAPPEPTRRPSRCRSSGGPPRRHLVRRARPAPPRCSTGRRRRRRPSSRASRAGAARRWPRRGPPPPWSRAG